MRVYIREPERHFRLRLVFPTRLLMSRLGVYLIGKGLGSVEKIPENLIKPVQIRRFVKEMLRMKRKFPGMELVEVKAADGTIVKVRL